MICDMDVKALARFEDKYQIDPDTECWNWTASKDQYGYGQFRLNSKMVKSHRASYEYYVCKIPNHLQMDHLCRNRSCCNPSHLEAVTAKENIRRSDVGKHESSKTHCPQEHPYAGDNLYMTPDGRRQCRTCRSHRAKRRQEKSK